MKKIILIAFLAIVGSLSAHGQEGFSDNFLHKDSFVTIAPHNEEWKMSKRVTRIAKKHGCYVVCWQVGKKYAKHLKPVTNKQDAIDEARRRNARFEHLYHYIYNMCEHTFIAVDVDTIPKPKEPIPAIHFASFLQNAPDERDKVDTFKISVPYGWLEELGFKLSDILYFWYSETLNKFEKGNPNIIFNYVNSLPFHSVTKIDKNPMPGYLAPAFKWKKGQDSLIVIIRKGEIEED